MMQELPYQKLAVPKSWPMRRMIGPIPATLLLVFASMVASCEEPEEKSIVGTWKVTKAHLNGDLEPGYSGDWNIDKDGTYNLGFITYTGEVVGPVSGHSVGEYHWLSDSIMKVTSLEHSSLDINYAFRVTPDTLFIGLEGSTLKTRRTRMIGPTMFEHYGSLIEWGRE